MKYGYGANECCEQGTYEIQMVPYNATGREVHYVQICEEHVQEYLASHVEELKRTDVFEVAMFKVGLSAKGKSERFAQKRALAERGRILSAQELIERELGGVEVQN